MAKRPIFSARWSWPLFWSDLFEFFANVFRGLGKLLDTVDNQLSCVYYREADKDVELDAEAERQRLLSVLDGAIDG